MQTIEEIYRIQLAALVKEYGTQAALSKVIGKSTAQISQWINGSPDSKTGKPRVLSRESAREIEKSAGKPVGWMDRLPIENTAIAQVGYRQIPVISWIQAGVWTEIVDNFQPGDADTWINTDLDMSDSSFALEITGNSMEPDFQEGDRVIIDPDVSPRPGDFVAAKNDEQAATFKKYRPRGIDERGNTFFELVPLNEDYETLRSDRQPIQIIGTMVEHRKYRKRR